MPRSGFGIPLLAAIVIGVAGCNRNQTPPSPPATSVSPADAPSDVRVVGPLSDADAAALATMNARLKQYIEVHTKVESELPRLPDSATPEQIDTKQRAFEQRIRATRTGAKQGDLFTAEAQPVIKRLLASVFSGPEGKQMKDSIMDENPVGLKVAVNGRYPDSVPISTIPPQVLQTLPKLNEDMEYRFVGNNLILLDAQAHIIADFIPNALPE